MNLTIHPLTPDRWGDLEALFGPRGACGGCWCMTWRLPRKQFDQQKGEGNRAAFREIVRSGQVPGLLAYLDDGPVGWVAVAPRDRFPVLQRSRVLAPVDDLPVWSVTCFFIQRRHRGQGVAAALLAAALDFARQHGATMVEGYPTPVRSGKMPDAFAWTGTESLFAAAGFQVAARRGTGKAVWRRAV